MLREDKIHDHFFCCQVCGREFHTPLYTITSKAERSEFHVKQSILEIESQVLKVMASCCSPDCLRKKRETILLSENLLTIQREIGTDLCCSRCGGVMDTTQFHETWVAERAVCTWGKELIIEPVDIDVLAEFCAACSTVNL